MPGQATVDVEIPVLHTAYLWGSITAMARYQFSAIAVGGERIYSGHIGMWKLGGKSSSTMKTDYCISSGFYYPDLRASA